MNTYRRRLDLRALAERKSLFLFGPRQTGKTFLLKESFPQSPFYNLLLADQFLRLSQRPQIMREELLAAKIVHQPIIVDEVQKLPILLDEVHHLIEEKQFRFVLTGSNARKLKQGGANLLGGRAMTRHLCPLVTAEVPGYDLLSILNFGSLPFVTNSDNKTEDLRSYVGTYLKEEIQAEGAVRRIENFSRFLQLASLVNGQLLNFSNVASDMGMAAKTIREYFHILEDTLVGYFLEPFTKTRKRKAISTAKFYFFDIGVANSLSGRTAIAPRTELFGSALEHLILLELIAFRNYVDLDRPLHFWRSTTGHEVDFLFGDVAIEVKSTELVAEKHLSGIGALAEENVIKQKMVVSMDPSARLIGDVQILPVTEFLASLWNREI